MDEPFAPGRPIYLQIVRRICAAIVRGDLSPGEKLPSVRDTALSFGVNPNTIQRVFAELEQMGVGETRRGQGTFVTAEKGRIDALRSKLQKEAVGAFVKQMRAMGLAGAGIVQAVSDYLSRETDDGEKERGTN